MTVIRKYHCKDENCPHESLKSLSDWIRKNCPPSQNSFCVSDLDFILWNYSTKKVIMLEVKTRNAGVKDWQKIMWSNLRKWIQRGIDDDWTFFGFHCIRFEKTSFQDGLCFFDNHQISEDELKEILSMEYETHPKLLHHEACTLV